MSALDLKWTDVGALDSIPIRGARMIRTIGGCIAVFRTAENEAFALDDRCPHKGGPLSQGIVHGKSVTCPLHNWVIGLVDGNASGADQGSTKTYPLKIEDGRILIDVSSVETCDAA